MGGRRRWWNGNGRISIFLLLLLQGAVSVTASETQFDFVAMLVIIFFKKGFVIQIVQIFDSSYR